MHITHPQIHDFKMFLLLKGTYLASKPVFGGITYVPQFMFQPFKWYPPGKENMSHPWKRNIIFNTAFPGDMLVPRRIFSSAFFIIWTSGLRDLLWPSAKRLTKWTTAHWRHILHCKRENLDELYIKTCQEGWIVSLLCWWSGSKATEQSISDLPVAG